MPLLILRLFLLAIVLRLLLGIYRYFRRSRPPAPPQFRDQYDRKEPEIEDADYEEIDRKPGNSG
ncbi:MAG: hypothetical protein JW958_08820 [Candidatus Eisenbacteria bacterium]|nr:hypothetical protein [Candidatus Eisenbacteria bacterium]